MLCMLFLAQTPLNFFWSIVSVFFCSCVLVKQIKMIKLTHIYDRIGLFEKLEMYRVYQLQ